MSALVFRRCTFSNGFDRIRPASLTLQELGQAMQRLEPPLAIVQERIPVREAQEVLVLAVAKGEDGPYLYDGRPWQRVGTTTQRMPAHEYERRLLARLHSQHRWENRTADGYAMDDLDLKEVETTVTAAVEAGRLESGVTSTSDALVRLGLVVDGQILQAAVVAFGKRFLPAYPQCALRLARFRGTSKTEFLDQRGPGIRQFELPYSSERPVTRAVSSR